MGRVQVGGRARRGLLAVAAVFGSSLAVGLSSPVPAGAGATGATWVAANPPLPANVDAGTTSKVQAVRCPAPGSCVAVGTYISGGKDALFAATQTNGVWTETQVPNPPSDDGTDTVLIELDCPAVGWCVATGRYSNAGNFDSFAAVLSGGHWSTTTLPLPPTSANPSAEPQNLGLSCPISGWCVAVGNYSDPSTNIQSYIDTLANGTWTSIVAPLPPGAASDPEAALTSISCPDTTYCLSGGTYLTTNTTAFFDSLSGTTWTAAIAPVPHDATVLGASVKSVACSPPGYNPAAPILSASECVVVGTYQNASGGQPLAWAQSPAGGAITVTPIAVPSGAAANPRAELDDVSCPVAGWCEAAGSYETPAFSGGLPMVANLSNGTWTVQQPAGVAADAVAAFVNTISCSWPGSCVAAGLELLSASQIAFIETETNGVWAGNGAVLPNGPVGSTESGTVRPSCVAGTCLEGGEYLDHPGTDLGWVASYPNLTGYQEVASDGGLFSFNVPFNGSMGGKPLNAPIVGMTVEPDNGGYYEVASDGGIFAFNAPFYGSMGGKPLNKPIVGIAFDTVTGGYYEVASDGGIFAFNAPFQGSMGGKPLNKPIVGMTFDPLTGGYFEVASDGGIFAFNAPFQGSMGGKPLNKPVVGIAFDPQTGGYYEVASDGGLFAFNAPFQGSMGGKPLNAPVVGMDFDYASGGYYEVASDGGLFAFNAPFQGSMGGKTLNKPMVGLAFG